MIKHHQKANNKGESIKDIAIVQSVSIVILIHLTRSLHLFRSNGISGMSCMYFAAAFVRSNLCKDNYYNASLCTKISL